MAVEGARTWEEDLASLMEDTGIRFAAAAAEAEEDLVRRGVFRGWEEEGTGGGEEDESVRDQVEGFVRASGELVRDLGRSCVDIFQQSVVGMEESYVVKRLRGPVSVAKSRLGFLNEFLPEDRDPAHAWPVVIFVFLIAFSALTVNTEQQPLVQPPKKVQIHPATATRIQLPDGRYIAYREQGVPAESARFSMISPHSFLSSRLAGIPGIKDSLLEEFGVRSISYDLPGYGESDPHVGRNLNSSALDMLYLANALGVVDKFWVVGYSTGAKHAWAAVQYIPNRLAGAAMFAPMGNPYDTSMTKDERRKTWEKWTTRQKLLFFFARRFPFFLRYFYSRSFLSGKHGQPEEWFSMSMGKKDKDLVETQAFKEFWERDVEESVRQGDVKPFIEEAALQVSNWGFSLSEIQVQKKVRAKGIIPFLKALYSQAEREWAGFLGPIHIWQGTDDKVTPPSMIEYVRRVVPGATVHRLLGEGHFSYFCFCDDCHRNIFSTLFGVPKGPLQVTLLDEISPDEYPEEMCHNCTEQE